jgi:hypothetical protein
MTRQEWIAEAVKRYGKDAREWKFRCPVCGFVASVQDWKDAGAPQTAVAFSCIGRWRGVSRDAFKDTGKGPCNYAGGGLFRLNPVRVFDEGVDLEFRIFDFADNPLEDK